MWINKIRANRKKYFVMGDELTADNKSTDSEQSKAEEPKAEAKSASDEIVCKKCGAALSKSETVTNKYVCKECGYYFRVRTKNRIKMVADAGTFEPWFEDVEETNPLNFPGYEEKLAATQEKTVIKEGVTIGYASMDV